MPDETSSIKLKPLWRRWLTLGSWKLAIGYTVMLLSFTLLQRYLIYVPTRLTPEFAEQAAAKIGFVPWRNKSGKLIGWKLPASSPPIGSILILHGNAGWALNRAYIAMPIHDAAALDVYILEYPGYGARAGSPGEGSFLSAADEAFENLPKNLAAYLVSESLGTGVAAHLARKYPSQVAGITMFVPYDKLASVAENHIWFLPAYFLLWDRFDPAAWLKKYNGPIKIVVAGADEIIPPILGQRLYDGYEGPKILQIISGVRHNDTAEQSSDWWKETLTFWRQHATANYNLITAR